MIGRSVLKYFYMVVAWINGVLIRRGRVLIWAGGCIDLGGGGISYWSKN